ncbi:MAG: hypothetical protein R3E32_20270 [Chitinophagales bacterium]
MVQKLAYIILFVNIFEAVFFDFIDADYFNAILGAGVMLSLKRPSAFIINEDSKYRDLEYDISFAWMLAYCFWNCSFVYNFDGGVALPTAFLHLGLPLIVSFFHPKLFIQNRIYFLLFTVAYFAIIPPQNLYFKSSIYVPWIAHTLTIIGFIFLVLDIFGRYKKREVVIHT